MQDVNGKYMNGTEGQDKPVTGEQKLYTKVLRTLRAAVEDFKARGDIESAKMLSGVIEESARAEVKATPESMAYMLKTVQGALAAECLTLGNATSESTVRDVGLRLAILNLAIATCLRQGDFKFATAGGLTVIIG